MNLLKESHIGNIKPSLYTDSLTRAMEEDFMEMLDKYHALAPSWDSDMDRQIAKWYAKAPDTFPKRPYFSPSSVDSCPQSLYWKHLNAPKDNFPRQPHQARWQNAGTATGDWMQRDLLMIEKHYEKITGEFPRFVFDRTEKGEPFFEDFVKRSVPVEANGQKFFIHGAPDGVMFYETDDGEIVKVGIEIKSKQTTSAKTSQFSMREAQLDHFGQTVLYSKMYDVDYYLIVYVNLSKKTWSYTEEDYEKTPDVRVFGYKFDDGLRDMYLGYLGELMEMFNKGVKPPLDINGWTFNPYKVHSVKNLTDEEIADIVNEVEDIEKGSFPKYIKTQARETLNEILQIRKLA